MSVKKKYRKLIQKLLFILIYIFPVKGLGYLSGIPFNSKTSLILFVLVLVIYLLSKNSKSITDEANLTRARQTADYQNLYDNIYKFNEHYKEFDKLMRLLRKDIKSLNMITDDLTTALNMKNNKKHNEQFYKDLITNINKFAKVKPKLKIVKTEKEKDNGNI